MDGVRTAEGGDGVTGALIRARIWRRREVDRTVLTARFWGHRWQPTVAVASEMAG